MTPIKNQPATNLGETTTEEITDALKLRRIREIIHWYHRPPDERIIAPESVIERIDRVLKQQ